MIGALPCAIVLLMALAAVDGGRAAAAETTPTADLGAGLSMVESDGALVVLSVKAGTPAARAGLRVGDRIVSVDGTAVSTKTAFETALAQHLPGPARLGVTSGGQLRTLSLDDGSKPEDPPTNTAPSLAALPPSAQTPAPGAEEASFLGLLLREHGGLEVVGVVQGSPAEAAGIQRGDRVVTVDGRVAGNRAALLEETARHHPGDILELTVQRTSGPSSHRVVLARRDAKLPPMGAPIAERTEDVSPELGRKLGLSYSESRVTRVFEPVDSANLFTWSFTVNANFASSGKSTMSGASLGYRYLDPDGSFPAGDSGYRNCFSLEASLGALGGAIDIPAVDIPGVPGVSAPQRIGGEPAALFFMRATLVPTYTLLYFGSPSENGLQSGIGFKIGAELGGSLSVFSSPLGGTMTDISPLIGPALGLELPSFNPGTARLSLFTVTAVIIPLNGVSATVSVGGAF